MFRPPGHPITVEEFEAEVRAGLSRPGQKTLPWKYLYDDLGTALFQAITLLPEYGLTRADLRLLRKHSAELPARAGDLSVVAELGSGSGDKARWILPHLARQSGVTYCPIDISAAALVRCQRDLSDIQHLRVVPIQDSYIEGLASASKLRRPETSMLVLFLGSSIGNFEPPIALDFLRAVRENMKPGDALLLSCDLVKTPSRMLTAYDDAIGLTAAFNLNVLARINRDLGAAFDLKLFRHEARYNAAEQRIEMHLRSVVPQKVFLNPDFSVALAKDETIWTESSYKFHTSQVREIAERAGFVCEVQYTDTEWSFAQNLLRAA